MDCDENDFQNQSQKQQLADEGSTKFSPVLQPFGLSKFDFDDNLQGHLRFDSLVESEVFLGIGNNIDSHWIEDYSRGNSAIEFTTCASESCSISRHNNVWSEATSSESVEMLLKSVGLEEAMPIQPSIQPSNSSEPCSTITQMEPNLTDNTGIISDKTDASQGESLSPLTEISPSSTAEKAVKEHQPFAEVVLQTWNGTSSEGNLIKEDLSIRSENFGSPTALNLDADRKDAVAHGESDKSQHLSDLEIQELNVSASMEIVATDYDRTENMAVLDQENTVDNVFHAESQNDTNGGEPLTITEEACRNNEYFEETTAGDVQFTSDTVVSDHLTEAYMEEGNDMRINAVLESPDIPPKASLDVQFVDELAEGTSAPTAAQDQATPVENVVLVQDAGVGGLSEGREDRSPSVSRLTEDLDKCDSDVGVGSTLTEVPSGFEQPMDSSKQKSLLATGTSTDNTDVLDQDPSPSALAVMPKEEVQRNDAFGDPVGQVTREQVATEKSTLLVGPAEEGLGPLEFKQGFASLAGRDELGGFTNSEVPVKSGEAALESSARDNAANAEMDTSSNQLSVSVLPCELPSHHSAPEVDREPCLTCPDVADGAARESHRVCEMIEAATHSPISVDTGKEVIDKSGSTSGKGDDIFPTLEKADEVSVEGSSSMTPGNICESTALPSIDHSNSSNANISSPIVISSVEVSEKEISQEQTEKSINQKLLPSDGKDMFDMQNTEETEISKDDKSFTFDVKSLDKRDLTKNWEPFSSVSDLKATQVAEGSTIPALLQVEEGSTIPALLQVKEGSTIPALLQVENQGLVLNNVGTPQKPVKETSRGRKKDSSEHKPKRASRKGAAKESGKKSSSVKDSAASKQIETVDKLSPHSITSPGAHQPLPSGELQHHGQIDFTAAKGFGVLKAATSGLSDLNSSAFGNMVFCQPFTDLQQVQLRAQIFVYGSLISKLVPEEVHMISAFGGPDGGRSMWENAWCVCRERVLGSVSAILETPVKSRAGEVIFDQVTNHGTRQAAVSSSPAVRSNSKGMASPAINLVQPLSSPVWSISTQSFDASQFGALPKGAVPPTFSTFHPNQSPPVVNFFGPSSSWMSQTPFRSPWSASPQTSMQESGAHVPLLPVTESVKLAPVLESPVSVPSGTVSLPSVPAGLLPSASPAFDPKKVAILPGHHSESKSRKRKKASASADPVLISSNQSQIQLSPIPAPIGPHSAIYPSIGPHSAIFAPASTAGFLSETRMDKHVLKSPSYSFGDPGLQEFVKSKSALSEESIVKVREAMKQAEDAAALASTAVNHSQAIWDQLNKYKNSGNVATAEVKLASVAAAISAAASVAKAAAAAASVASKAALQAKLMADEAMNPSRSNGHSSHGDYSSIVGGKDFSSSISRGDTATNFSNSAISEAREAVRKKIEAASAASLQAENLDALVKAAELAAEAIAKAGKVVAMGDPLPLTVLAEAGPDGFWKLATPKDSSELYVAKVGVTAATITDSVQQMAGLEHNKGTLVRSLNETLGLENSSQGKKGSKVSDTGNSEGNLLAELQYGLDNATHNDVYGAVETSQQNNIKVGAQVEVFKSGEEFKSAWFSANVLRLKDGKALVCYSEIPCNEGSGKLEEWVDLECVVDEPPKLRLAHPMTVMKFEGTRKRRRAAMGVFTCSVGDKVDAWIKDCWREGVVTDKDKKDGTTVTVHFPAYGDNSVVRAWHLRPSLIWKNGEWVEWTSTVGSMNLEGDTPQEKRAKLGTPGLAPREKDRESKETQLLVEKEKSLQEESLKLTSQEKVFTVGKKAADGKKDPVRTRTGLRKESSRVVIGVPKPGKKRKFMEVSKHLVGNQTKKTGELKDSAKLASYLIPQGGGPHGWKPFSRSDTKDKGVADSKTKVLRSGRSQNTSGRVLPPKSNLAAANSSDGPPRDIPDHDAFKRHNTSEFKPLSESEDAASEGHGDPVTSSDTGFFKSSMATVRAARVTKGRVLSGKVAKDEENKALSSDPSKSAADGAEPRRSNRRIQPTSRLLEGLQSSITITKFPSALHDRGHKVAYKDAAKGKSNG